MNNSAIIILVAILLAWIILATIWCSIVSKKYKQYISSIKIGDKFMMRGTFDEDVNPFEERRKPIIVEIIDIKTNKILGVISGMEKDIPPPKKVKSKTPQ